MSVTGLSEETPKDRKIPLSLDILIPTFNRSHMLGGCLESFFAADPVSGMDWRVTVIDNNSADATKEVVHAFSAKFGARVRYLFEPRPGKSLALNCGIAASDRLLIGMIDDDELIDRTWLTVVEDCFQNPELDYIGGPYLGLWRTQRPEWLPPGYAGVLSADDPAQLPPQRTSFADESLFLRGGNAVVKRALFDRVGLYDANLGRFATGLGSCEDHDMFTRLKTGGAAGLFVPELIIHHIVPPERVTRSYFRRWVWDRSLSLAQMNRLSRENVAHFGKIPRYMIGKTLRSTAGLVSGNAAARFAAELEWRSLLGFIYGAYFAAS
jgi:glycosyltransferase involved in cell wall biosynthesis